MSLQRLELASKIYTDLVVVQAALRTAVQEQMVRASCTLGANEYVVLRHLVQSKGAVAIPDVEALLAVSRAAARRVIKRLLDDGYVSASAAVADRRSRYWQATELGCSLILIGGQSLSSEAPLIGVLRSLDGEDLAGLINELHLLGGALLSAADHARVSIAGSEEASAPNRCETLDHLIDIWTSVVCAYRRIRVEQTQYLMQISSGVLDTAAYMALYRVHEQPSNIGGVTSFLRVDQNTAARVIDRLERAGLVSRSRNPSSRREVVISISDEGVRLLEVTPPLNPNGEYVNCMSLLTDAGQFLAQALQRVVVRYVKEPVLDTGLFQSLMKRAFDRLNSTDGPVVDSESFRLAMAQFLTGVAVVTVKDGETFRAITVNSLTSVSLNPPMLLVCFDRRSRCLQAINDGRSFGVSILTRGQQHLAARFGRRDVEGNSHEVESNLCDEIDGVPLLSNSLAGVVCDLDQSFQAGSHTVVLAMPRKVIMDSASSGDVLGFWRSKYVHVGASADVPWKNGAVVPEMTPPAIHPQQK